MKKSTTAALISALVFPGSGHYYLKKHVFGTILIVTACISLYIIIIQAIERTLLISEKLQRGEMLFDIETILNLAMQHPTGTDVQLLNIATTALIIAWLIGIIDSFRVGRVQDKEIKL